LFDVVGGVVGFSVGVRLGFGVNVECVGLDTVVVSWLIKTLFSKRIAIPKIKVKETK